MKSTANKQPRLLPDVSLPEGKQRTQGSLWTPEELLVTLAAYLEMLRLEQRGEAYSKAEHRRKLLEGVLLGRTAASVEFRMQNISAVLLSIGQPYLKGYAPARNVGAKVIAQILEFLAELDPELPIELRRQAPAPTVPPPGNPHPKKREVTLSTYERDPEVVAFVLNRAQGICECCGRNAPFLSKNGQPFLEVHHVEALALDGPDTPQNCAAICPNCHQEAHYGMRSAEIQRELQEFLAALYNQS
ncbi:HNH endonuclease [Deinococcus sp. HMF7620]|uniref:HNH endonuclease n=1 Tax=Deinococcus arboris TaxID=2682977 RepID=A0A7C9HYZ5_9DEIO|nr:HNH endonuclease signature motif containing protein [Deinococcus arboris]MVN87610.1 HNH endonuclease [Deinococcus arboris]